jgi:CheY-like chemotaxis protein
MSGVSQVPIEAVVSVEGIDRSGVLTGRITLEEATLRLELAETEFAVPLETIDRVTGEGLPEWAEDRFADGILVQWERDGHRWRVFFETKSDSVTRIRRHMYTRILTGAPAKVKQTVTPNSFDTDREQREHTTETTIEVDPESRGIGFGDETLEQIQIRFVTTVDSLAADAGETDRPVVRVRTLVPEHSVESRIQLTPDRRTSVLRDHLVTATKSSETGGPLQVLFVDDEPGLIEIAKLHIRDEHDELAIQFALNTPRALDLIESEEFECIVTDYVMPEGGASEIVRATDESVPVIVYSRKVEADIPEEQQPSGVAVWVEKEMGTDQYHRLAQTIKRLVATYRAET